MARNRVPVDFYTFHFHVVQGPTRDRYAAVDSGAILRRIKRPKGGFLAAPTATTAAAVFISTPVHTRTGRPVVSIDIIGRHQAVETAHDQTRINGRAARLQMTVKRIQAVVYQQRVLLDIMG